MTKILAVGDVQGNIDDLCTLYSKYPDIDLVLQVGDFNTARNKEDLKTLFSPPKYREIKDFPDYFSGKKRIPLPTYFIGGNHESWGFLENFNSDNEVTPNLNYFGRVGLININGLHIAGVSGIFSKHYTQLNERDSSNLKDRSYFIADDIKHLRSLAEIDILLLHEWPNNLFQHEEPPKQLADRFGSDLNNVGHSDLLYDIIVEKQPEYVFCGHTHLPYTGKIGKSNIYCLSILGTEGDHKIIDI
ncbi:hypothetical protein HN592_01470 [Candidatus Woesearchaeota archaeon]|jgi:lariat debranching enzyme|nr:hypothetical protein [Candidatus Woesearchaeota archaeon]MBT4532296.1 hypothetical protein [archaeon]MBT6638935.1 hypothetical protein [Candidatus Woesearchaeota archaeon]MBT7134163.1 hypothetical protein [Candidatus Woesearchaeota archaeon]MBT7442053.1 hypothetical protein [Candidatus Woesearchaeota archaeon]